MATAVREIAEFRIPEANAQSVLSPTDGEVIGGSVRKLVMTLPDPRFDVVGRAERDRRAQGRAFFTWWDVTRRYTEDELRRAPLVALDVACVFEPSGEEYGTLYDESSACKACGAGARRVGPLWLPLRAIPKAVDVARTIGGEVVVSPAFAEAVVAAGLTGFELRPVRDGRANPSTAEAWARIEQDSRMLEAASTGGVDPGSMSYVVWMGAQRETSLMQAVLSDAGLRLRRGSGRPWYELVVPQTVEVASETRFGENPFSDPDVRPDRCPRGHVLGLNRLSELSVAGSLRDADLAATTQFVGVRRGLLRPEPMLVASQRFRELVQQAPLSGFVVEVAHVVSP
jgi:hypothetical protein